MRSAGLVSGFAKRPNSTINPDAATLRRLSYPLAMKKPLVIAGIVLGLAVMVSIAAVAWKAFTITDPYLVKPLTSSPAPAGASVGHSVASGSRTLSIVSTNDVVVVADPGASFQYEVVWLVERPRKDGTHTLTEFKCKLPQYAAVGQINPLSAQIPPKIQRVADGGQW